MTAHTLFVSDLHLEPARPAITDLFLDFLDGPAGAADGLYILGDLFEAWIGDDDDDPHHERVIEGIRALAANGVAVFFLPGNRDFLTGARFADRSQCTLLPDPTLVDLYGTPTLLMHGDTLCTDDHAYQAFRRQVRQTDWQAQFLAKPLAERRAIAQHLRERSQAEVLGKASEIMDVNSTSVNQVMREYQVAHLIHGHTHRPAVHDFELDGQAARRMVLGAWYEHGSVLRVSPGQQTLETLPIPD